MGIKSSKFSFVRFNNDHEQGCVDLDYVLPAYINHEVAFQFQPDGNVDPGTEYTISKSSAGCDDDEELDAPVYRLNFKAVMVLSQLGNFFLQTITYGIVSNTYNEIVTLDEFLDILSADFGFNAFVNDDGEIEFETVCDDLAFSMTATTEDEGAGEAVTAEFALYYGKGYVDLSGIPLGAGTDCFRYKIDGSCSNLFKPITDPCYTSLITYGCKEPAFDFIYPDSVNKIRVPAYLTKPTWPKKREVYRRSSGRNEVLASSVDKIYPMVTDHMPEVFHECMAIALSHDDIIIDNVNTREGIVEVIEADDYLANWIDDDVLHNRLPVARGSAKLKVAKYSYSNSNCGVAENPCEQEIPEAGTCDQIDVDIAINFGDPNSYTMVPVSPVPEGDAFQILIIEVETGFTVASTYAICSTPGGCTIFENTFDIDDLTLDPDKCYSAVIYRICGYSTSGVPVFATRLDKTGLGTCDAPLPDGEISVTNSNFGATINNVTGVTGFTFDTGAPVAAGDEQSGTHGNFTAVIAVTIGGTLGFNPGNITITKNGTPVFCQTVTGSGTFTSPPLSFLYSDDIGVALNGGACP